MQTEQLVFKQEVTKPNRQVEKRVVQVDSVVRNIKVKNGKHLLGVFFISSIISTYNKF